MNRFSLKLLVVVGLVAVGATAASAQDINPTPFFTSYADTMIASTFNGQPLPVGAVIQAYDPTGVYCGTDTVRFDVGSGMGIFGYFAVYGDDAGTTGIDEGASNGEQITFKVNGHDATVTQGDDTWTDQQLKSVTLAATGTIAVSGMVLPNDTLIMPGDTTTMTVQVRNDGDGLDFYGVSLSLSVPTGTGLFDWETYEPDSVVYAEVGETVSVLFTVRAPTFNADTAATVTYSVYSHLDPTVSVDGTARLYMSLTDVDDDLDGMLPGSFALEQNYPNPFNPGTTIAWELPQSAALQLDIIDITGRTVDSYSLGRQMSGPGRFEYDASHLASGVYFYRLSSESVSKTRKMVLLK